MRILSMTAVLATLGLLAAPALADHHEMPEMTPEQMAEMQAYMAAGTPGEPHAAMAAQAGEYELTIKSWGEPDGPAMESMGKATRTMMLDGRVMVEEVESSMMGMPFTGHGMHGYDNVSKKHWSTWTDSMSTGLMVSEGTCDDAGKCTMTGSWNDPVTGGTIESRMEVWWEDDSTQMFVMYAEKDGEEMKMMEITYSKK